MPHRHSRLRTLFRVRTAACLLLAGCCAAGWAQTPGAAPAGAGELSDSERAKRDADKVFQWIRIHSDKPRKTAAAAAPAAAPVAAAAAKPARATVRSGESGITETVTPIVATANVSPQAAPPVAVERTAAPAPQSEAAPVAVETRVAALAAAPQPVEEDMALIPIHRTEPEFSGALMRSLRKGQVQVSFTVKPDGTVAQAQAVTSTHPRLKEVAVATVSQWRFQPLHHAQQAVVDLGFNLD